MRPSYRKNQISGNILYRSVGDCHKGMKSVQNRKALAVTPKVLFKFLNNYRLTRSLQKTVQGGLMYPHPISSLFQRPFQILLLFWRYNSHTISFTHLQCASLVYTQACVTIIILKRNPFPLTVTPHSLFLLPGNHQFPFCIYAFAYSGHSI